MIYVNARFLTQRITGVQRFAIEISKQLKKLRADVTFVAPDAILNKSDAEELNVQTFGNLKGHAWEQISLPLFLKKKNNPLLLNLANTAPLVYSNQVVTVHDIAFKVNPSWFSKSFSAYYNFIIPKILSNSKKIVTVSNSSKRDLIQAFGIQNTKIEVVYNAISQNIMLASGKSSIDSTYGPYILAVSSMDPRKNLDRLLEAFNKVTSKEIKLLLVGGGNTNFAESKVKGHINPKVQFLGYVTDQELATLYSNAEVFLYPSLYEGFGLPNIEAMHFGCPVITSDIAACREVCGDAAVYVDPESTEHIAENINLLLENEQLKDSLSQQSLLQSKKYSWGESAIRLSSILDQSLNQK